MYGYVERDIGFECLNYFRLIIVNKIPHRAGIEPSFSLTSFLEPEDPDALKVEGGAVKVISVREIHNFSFDVCPEGCSALLC